MFLIFNFWSWIFEKTSKFWAAPCKKASNPPACSDHGLHRILSSYWLAHFHLMEYGLAKKIAAWAHANRDPNKQEDFMSFCMEWLRTLNSYQIFKIKNKKLKTYSGWCPIKGLSNDTTLMQIQSGRTVPLISKSFIIILILFHRK
jgi:hypothetical protein